MANLTDTKIFGQLTVSRNAVVQGASLTLDGEVINSARIAEWDSGGSSRVTGVSGTGNTTLTLIRDGETNLTTSLAHGHGNISSAGAIGTTAGLMVKTGSSGVLTALAAGSSGQFLQYNGTWATPSYTVNTNYYPTAFDWVAGGAAGPTGKLTISGATDVTFAAIPLASASASGVVSTGTQTFAGAKTFSSAIVANVTGNVSGSAGSVAKAITFNNGGSGVASGTTFNGSAARTISYNTVGAAASTHTHAASNINSGTLDIARIPTGNTSATVCIGDDSRLSNARTPVAHTHGNITNDGKVGATENLVVVTGTSGAVTTASRSGIDSRSSFPPSTHTHSYAGSSSAGGAANSTKAAVTFNNGGTGADSGTTFNGSTAQTISYNTIGAAASTHTHAATDITSGTLAVARGGTGKSSVTTKYALLGPLAENGAPTWRSITSADVSDATNASTANMVVKRDASKNFSAGTITAALSGNATTATTADKVANTLTLAVSGTGLSGSATFDGSSAKTFTVTSNATSDNTASTIVARDASKNFSAGTITAALSGNATTATTASKVAKAITFNNEGTGVDSGTTFNGSAARTISYNTIGAQKALTGATSDLTASDLTAKRALISNASGKVEVSTVTSTELGYLGGATGNLQQQITDLASSGSSIVIYTNNVTLATENNTINILDGSPGFTFNSATDTLMVFENFVYLLRVGVDYTVNGSSIVTTGSYFKAGEYNFIVFKNINYAAASGQSAVDNHAASTVAHGATSSPTANTIAMRDASGELYATKVYNAVWNDIVDFIELPEDIEIEYGKVYTRDSNSIRKANKRDKFVLGVASDTYGFGVGKDEKKNQIPIAIGGWVLVHIDKVYPFGTPLTYTENGCLTKANLLTRIFHSYKIIATFDRVEKEEKWNGVKVKNRHWVHIL